MQQNNDDILLRVERLEQCFKNGKFCVKAVDDVSFELKKGEVFGLVGESGCGKTTTGRSIIKLYDITSGSVDFEGQRICAGTRSYKQVVKDARKECRENKTIILKKLADQIANVDESKKKELKNLAQKEIEALEEKFAIVCKEQAKNISEAIDDNKNCNKKYAAKQVEKTIEEFKPRLDGLTAQLDSLAVNKIYRLIPIRFLRPNSRLTEQAFTVLKEYRAVKKVRDIQIRFNKKDRIMNKMQMIFQDPIASLNPRMTVKEMVAEGLVIRGFKDKQVIEERVYEVLKLVGLVPEHATRYPHEFSGGQRQRIGIARAIILQPDLIIADEPVSALDVSIQAQVINLLNDLRKNLGLTIMFIAHDLSVVKYFSDRIAVMYFGKIVELTTSEELFKNPLHPYTKSLLSAIPLPDPITERSRQRIIYNPIAEHDYSTDKPSMRQIKEGHYIYCNDSEFEKYRAQLRD